MHPFTRIWATIFCFVQLSACHEETRVGYAVGTVLGPGCRSGSYAIQLQGKNRDYNIHEHVAYDNVVETLNLPEKYQISGQQICFTFTLPERDPTDEYLTYCTPPTRITIVAVTNSTSTDTLPVSHN